MEVRLTEKQAEYVREAHHRWNLATGAVRSGKSHLAVQSTIPDRLIEMHGRKGLALILGATKENIERNVLTPMRDIWGDRFVGDINARNWCQIFGERVYCIGAENAGQVSKLRGSEIKFAYCDEICDIHPEVFEMLKSRLSLAYSECHGACNPAGPNHWLKQFIDKGETDPGIDMFCQRYTIDDNPFLAAYPVDYVNDPFVIAQLDNFISINNCVDIDLFGQISSESSGTHHISGSGGQLDFTDGAYRSRGGKSIIALRSTFHNKKTGKDESRIKPTLLPGTIVTDPRSQVNWVATEYGMVNLMGSSTWERAEKLISIAHPDFREDLIKAADDMKIWRYSNKR